jgi:tRNA (cytidine/uridine-2'-O-)-methyltransferase
MRIALYQPDIAANTGTIIRLGACMGVAVDIIEPCGFPFGDKTMRRASMDYLPKATVTRHVNWQAFRRAAPGRILLATTRASVGHTDWRYQDNDTLLLGNETAGVPPEIESAADAAVAIRMVPGMRSLNVAVAASMILGEMLRQTRWTTGDGSNAQ